MKFAEHEDFSSYPPAVQARWTACKERVWEEAHKPDRDVLYGACPRGGDPRAYYPDLECCTRDEVLRWAEACGLWDRGDRHPEGPYVGSDLCSRDESFGIGVYWFVTPPGWNDEDDDAETDED